MVMLGAWGAVAVIGLVVIDEAAGRLRIQVAVDLHGAGVFALAGVVSLVGLEVLELGFKVSGLGFVAFVAGFLQLAAVLGDVGVDAVQELVFAAEYS